jgi:hypothetical protein
MMCPSQSGQLPSPPPAVPRHIGARSLCGPSEMTPGVPSGNTRRGYAVCAGGIEVMWLLSAIF